MISNPNPEAVSKIALQVGREGAFHAIYHEIQLKSTLYKEAEEYLLNNNDNDDKILKSCYQSIIMKAKQLARKYTKDLTEIEVKSIYNGEDDIYHKILREVEKELKKEVNKKYDPSV